MLNGDLALSHKKFLAKPIYRFAYRCLDNVKSISMQYLI